MLEFLCHLFKTLLRKHPGFLDRRHVCIRVPQSDGPGPDRWVWRSGWFGELLNGWRGTFAFLSDEHQPLRRELQDPDVCGVLPEQTGQGERCSDSQTVGRRRMGEVSLHYLQQLWIPQVRPCQRAPFREQPVWVNDRVRFQEFEETKHQSGSGGTRDGRCSSHRRMESLLVPRQLRQQEDEDWWWRTFWILSCFLRFMACYHISQNFVHVLFFFSLFFQEMAEQARSQAVESKTSEGWLKTA